MIDVGPHWEGRQARGFIKMERVTYTRVLHREPLLSSVPLPRRIWGLEVDVPYQVSHRRRWGGGR